MRNTQWLYRCDCRFKVRLAQWQLPFTCRCGKTISQAECQDISTWLAKRPPGVLRRGVNFLSAVARWELAGKPIRTDTEINAILVEHCTPCSFFNGEVCTHKLCGCPLKAGGEGWRNKLAWATESCPIGKWGVRAAEQITDDTDKPPRAISLEARLPRIAILTPSLKLGGAERCMVDLARWLDHERLDVLGLGVLTGRYDEQLLTKARSQGPVHLGRADCAELLKQADIMVTWGMRTLPVDSPPYVVYVSHTGLEVETNRMAGLAGVHLAAVSQWSTRAFPPDRAATVIHNGVEPERLQPRFGRRVFRAKFGIGEHEGVIGFVGRVVESKGALAAPRAAKTIGCRSLLVGTCSPAMQAQILALDPHAVILPPREEIGDVYAAMDCFMLASESEAFSLSLTEAWMSGVPAVATRVGAVPELEAVHGPLVVPVEFESTDKQLAHAVQQAISPAWNERVQVAQRLAKREFTAAAMGQRWTEYLVRLAQAEVVR